MSTRIHELAKKLKSTSKELIDKARVLKIDAKSHMSVLSDADVKKLKEAFAKPSALAKKTASLAAASKAVEASKTQALKAEASKVEAAKVAEKASQTPSIANVKLQFQLQREAAAKKVYTAPEIKRPQASATTSVAPLPSRKIQTSSISPIKPKPSVEIKKEEPAAHLKMTPKHDAAVATAAPQAPPVEVKRKKITIQAPVVVKDLAVQLSIRPSELIQRLIKLGIFASINQAVNFEIASKIAEELGFESEKSEAPQEAPQEIQKEVKDKSKLVMRAPIVTFMGHVDHGKTSLLDAIRKTKVAAQETGGITQHIGAYEVFLPKGAVTFLDTPGHEAFTAMRARGARATDVVVLVVAADDGVMPQTIEAIHHAQAAGVPIIVAINKMDLPAANPERVKKALMEHGLMSEDWGGKTIMTGVSAKTGKGIDELLEMLVLESELLELRADPNQSAKGVVIEAELSKGSGVLATVLVQDGTLRIGDVAIVGPYYCKVRAMINDRGQRIKEALPSMPVEILGLPGMPKAGDRFYVVKDEKTAKEIAEKAQGVLEGAKLAAHPTLEHIYEDIKAGKAEELKLVIKSDVQGSLEALQMTLGKIQSKNVRLNIIHSGVGDIAESDVMLAVASDAIIIGFRVSMSTKAKEIAELELVDVHYYEIIYEVKTAIEKAMEGLLQPELKEVSVGVAEVRQVFKVSKSGMIAGCTVLKGKIVRNFPCRVVRGGVKMHEGKVESLKRFKDDAREVLEGFECGIGVSNFDEIIAGDRIEVFEIQKKERKLE